MTLMQVIRDKVGTIINIGNWNFDETLLPSDVLGPGGQPVMVIVQQNPMPDGAREDVAEIVEGWDGGLYEVGDPRSEKH